MDGFFDSWEAAFNMSVDGCTLKAEQTVTNSLICQGGDFRVIHMCLDYFHFMKYFQPECDCWLKSLIADGRLLSTIADSRQADQPLQKLTSI